MQMLPGVGTSYLNTKSRFWTALIGLVSMLPVSLKKKPEGAQLGPAKVAPECRVVNAMDADTFPSNRQTDPTCIIWILLKPEVHGNSLNVIGPVVDADLLYCTIGMMPPHWKPR